MMGEAPPYPMTFHCEACRGSTAGNCWQHPVVISSNPSGAPEAVRYGTVRIWSTNSPTASSTIRLVGVPFCPDLLSIEDIGAADNFRGRVVRAFFRAIRWWKP